MFEILRRHLFVFLLGTTSLLHAAVSDIHDPTSFVGPTGKAQYTHPLTQNTAFSVLGEAGPRNYRLGATVGWLMENNQRFKISGEFLTQDILCSFLSGDTRKWVQQGAVGAQYLYDFGDCRFLPQFNLKAGYSHAPSKQLDLINDFGAVQNTITNHRVAGSNAGYVSPGVSIQPWHTGRVGVELNYDDVLYDRIYSTHVRAQGFGGSANLVQSLGANTSLGLTVGIRQPFNAYQATLAFTPPSYPDWSFGLDGNYVQGKHYLPNTYNVGFRVSYFLAEGQVSHEVEKEPVLVPMNKELSCWTASPAIYLPQVLAIADEGTTTSCTAPVLLSEIGPQRADNETPVITLETAPFFSGAGIIYSVTHNSPEPITISIDPSTGLLTIAPTLDNYEFQVTVRATNSCGSAASTFTVTVRNLD